VKKKKNNKKTTPHILKVPADGAALSRGVVINPDVSCRIEDEEHALLFNPDTDNSVLIDRTGLLIWKYIDKPRSIADITTYLRTSFSGCPVPETLRQDVEAYLHDLIPEFAEELT
jgi:hypothetical protein